MSHSRLTYSMPSSSLTAVIPSPLITTSPPFIHPPSYAPAHTHLITLPPLRHFTPKPKIKRTLARSSVFPATVLSPLIQPPLCLFTLLVRTATISKTPNTRKEGKHCHALSGSLPLLWPPCHPLRSSRTQPLYTRKDPPVAILLPTLAVAFFFQLFYRLFPFANC